MNLICEHSSTDHAVAWWQNQAENTNNCQNTTEQVAVREISRPETYLEYNWWIKVANSKTSKYVLNGFMNDHYVSIVLW